MNFIKLFGAVTIGLIFFSGNVSAAYDLPKIQIDKPSAKKTPAADKNKEGKKIFKSDWKVADEFEREVKARMDSGENLPASSPKRIAQDKNHVMIAFYKGNLYFLDKYSVEVVADSSDQKVWKQNIFPIGRNVSPKNAKATPQTFCTDGSEMYNSLKFQNNLDGTASEEDKIFLQECFKVGYWIAFGEEFTKKIESRKFFPRLTSKISQEQR